MVRVDRRVNRQPSKAQAIVAQPTPSRETYSVCVSFPISSMASENAVLTPPSAATNNAERREGHAGHVAKTDRAPWQQNERVGHASSQTSSKTCHPASCNVLLSRSAFFNRFTITLVWRWFVDPTKCCQSACMIGGSRRGRDGAAHLGSGSHRDGRTGIGSPNVVPLRAAGLRSHPGRTALRAHSKAGV